MISRCEKRAWRASNGYRAGSERGYTAVMKIIYNGEPREVADALTVAQLLAELNLTPRFVAVEVNLELSPRVAHAEHVLRDGDQVEVVTLVGGG